MARSKKQKAQAQAQADVYIPETAAAKDEKKAGAATGGNTVVVALCHPHGIQFILDGGKRRVRLNGNAANLAGQPKGILPLGGFGLTEIPVADWEAIKATYGRMEIFKNGLCFAHGKRADTLAEADEKAGLRHGREPVSVEGEGKDCKSEPVDMAAAALA